MKIGGEYDEQQKGFKQLTLVMAVSVFLIYMALVIQFRSAIKPFIVFAAIPYGMTGALAGLVIMGQPFGLIAFLGIAGLEAVAAGRLQALCLPLPRTERSARPTSFEQPV